MPQTTLARPLEETLLEKAESRSDALTAFKLAHRRFLDGRRIEMQELATALGVNRTTLFRWVGGRDDLLAEVVWSVAVPTLAAAQDAARRRRGGARIADVMGRFASSAIDSPFFTTFLQREPERAMRILTTRATSFQGRMVSAVEAMIGAEVEAGRLNPPLTVHDLAYLVVRIAETFIYSNIVAGETPDPAKVRQAIAALLRD